MRKLLILILITMICLSASYAEDKSKGQQDAEMLQELGLLKGSDKGFELERAPTRAEIAVMLIRLMGLETEVLASEYEHPFTDVPTWADKYIGYMYTNKLTNGISPTEFGSAKQAAMKDYCTFVLRALKYDDKSGDFTWSTSIEVASEKELLTNITEPLASDKTFIRNDLVLISANSLKVKIKDSELKLIDSLVEQSSIDKTIAEKYQLVEVTQKVLDISEIKDDEMKIQIKTYMKDDKPYFSFDLSDLPESIQKDFKVAYCNLPWGTPVKDAQNKEKIYTCAFPNGMKYTSEANQTEGTLIQVETLFDTMPRPTNVLSGDKILGIIALPVLEVDKEYEVAFFTWYDELYTYYQNKLESDINSIVTNAKQLDSSGFEVVAGEMGGLTGKRIVPKNGVLTDIDFSHYLVSTANNNGSDLRNQVLMTLKFKYDDPLYAYESEPFTSQKSDYLLLRIYNEDKEMVAYSIIENK